MRRLLEGAKQLAEALDRHSAALKGLVEALEQTGEHVIKRQYMPPDCEITRTVTDTEVEGLPPLDSKQYTGPERRRNLADRRQGERRGEPE